MVVFQDWFEKRWQTVVLKFEPEFEALNIKDFCYLKIFSSLNIGSVWALNFLFVIIRMARFWSLKILFQSNPQQVIPNCRWDSIKESYTSFIAAIGRYRFSLFITPRVRDILFAIFEEWDFQFMFSFIVSPRKLNWVTLSMTEPFSVRWGISFSAITFW